MIEAFYYLGGAFTVAIVVSVFIFVSNRRRMWLLPVCFRPKTSYFYQEYHGCPDCLRHIGDRAEICPHCGSQERLVAYSSYVGKKMTCLTVRNPWWTRRDSISFSTHGHERLHIKLEILQDNNINPVKKLKGLVEV